MHAESTHRRLTVSDRTSAGVVPRGVSLPNERLATKEYGEAYLVWCCVDCGAMGDLEAFPVECEECSAPREDLYYFLED